MDLSSRYKEIHFYVQISDNIIHDYAIINHYKIIKDIKLIIIILFFTDIKSNINIGTRSHRSNLFDLTRLHIGLIFQGADVML